MKIIQLTDRIFYYSHQPESDRPMLVYIKGTKISLAIDAGYSAAHVGEFYRALQNSGLEQPEFTVLTHWHYDHTFGLHQIHGLSIAHEKTCDILRQEKDRLSEPVSVDRLRKEDNYFAKEYAFGQSPVIALPDIQLKTELTLNLGEITAKLFHTESPHSEDSVCIYIPEEKILFLGDSTSEDFFNDGYMDSSKLEKLIRMISSTECRYCILSHTDPLEKEELLVYLNSVLESHRTCCSGE